MAREDSWISSDSWNAVRLIVFRLRRFSKITGVLDLKSHKLLFNAGYLKMKMKSPMAFLKF